MTDVPSEMTQLETPSRLLGESWDNTDDETRVFFDFCVK
jgi:hypothetical protein